MANPWLSYPVALVIAALVTVAAMAVFSTDPADFQSQDEDWPAEVSNASVDGLITLIRSGNQNQQIAAIMKLSESSEDLDKIVPVVARAAIRRDDLVRTAGVLALKKIGPEAANHIEPLFKSEEANDFRSACVVLQQIGPAGNQFIPTLKPYLKDENKAKVMTALFALENMGKEALPLNDDLIELLDHEDFNVQCGVCRIFEGMGPLGAPAQDRLVRLLEEGNTSTRGWAAIALGAIGPSEKHDIVGLLNKKLSTFTQIEKERAMIGLCYLGPKATAAIEEVKRLMNDPSKHSQARAAYTLWRITGETEQPLKILMQQLGDPSYVRDAMERLGEMGSVAAPALPQIQNELENEEPDSVELAVMTIGNLGKAAVPAVPDLQKKLNDKDLLIRQAARQAIAKIEAAAGAEK